MEIQSLSLNEMENISGGGWSVSKWLEAGCIAGGLSLAFLSGGTLALVGSLAIHSCLGYFLTQAYV